LANASIIAIILVMSRKKLIFIIGFVVIIGVAGAFYMFGGVEKVKAAFQPKNQQQTITLEGKVLCLPSKDGVDTSALACAMGLQTTEGKYFGLANSSNTELAEASGTDKQVKISGILQPSTNDTYKMEGIVAVSDFHFVK
jgi:hypothetical protein